jgi:hypothetical protein
MTYVHMLLLGLVFTSAGCAPKDTMIREVQGRQVTQPSPLELLTSSSEQICVVEIGHMDSLVISMGTVSSDLTGKIDHVLKGSLHKGGSIAVTWENEGLGTPATAEQQRRTPKVGDHFIVFLIKNPEGAGHPDMPEYTLADCWLGFQPDDAAFEDAISEDITAPKKPSAARP